MFGSSVRRLGVRAAMIAMLAATGLAATPPARACACGGVVSGPGRTTTVNGETALVSLSGGRETISMSLAARSDAARAGLLVPTPAPATPALGDRQVFTDLNEQTAVRTKVRHHLFGPPALFHDDVVYSGRAGAAPRAGVHVLGRVDLGPIQAITLTALDATKLHAWLRQHAFTMSPAFEQLVTPYLKQGWAFTAMNLTAEGRSLSGQLPPVTLTFKSNRLIYPMRMSRGAHEAQTVHTYVLSTHRVVRTDPSAQYGDLRTAYADRIRPSLVTSPALKKQTAASPWLTEFVQIFDQPSKQVVSDFTFAPAAHDTPVVQYSYHDEYLLPGDVAVLLLVLVAGVALAVFVVRRRRRPQPVTP